MLIFFLYIIEFLWIRFFKEEYKVIIFIFFLFKLIKFKVKVIDFKFKKNYLKVMEYWLFLK